MRGPLQTLQVAIEAKQRSAIRLCRDALHCTALAASGKSGGAMQDVSVEVGLQVSWHSCENIRLEPLVVLAVSGEGGHCLQLVGKAEVFCFEPQLIELVFEHKINLTRRLVRLLLFSQLPRLGDGLIECTQPGNGSPRATKCANDGGSGGNGEDGAVANATKARGVDHVGGKRRLELGHERIVLRLGDGASRDRLLAHGEGRGAHPRLIQELPDRPTRPLAATIEDRLKVPLVDEPNHSVARRTTVDE